VAARGHYMVSTLGALAACGALNNDLDWV
jgi:hypothetical protein